MTRTIRTTAELDALPVESVIRAWTTSRYGRPIFVRQPDGWFPRLLDFETMLPATVLYDPSAPAPASSVEPETAKTPPVERIEGTWLVEVTDEHTCGAGPGSGTGLHEPGCGLVPVIDLATLPGWEEHQAAAPSATRDELAKIMRGYWPEAGGQAVYQRFMENQLKAADALLARFTITPKEDR